MFDSNRFLLEKEITGKRNKVVSSEIQENFKLPYNYEIIRMTLKAIVLDLFEWTGLPEEVEPELIESFLYNYGTVGFFKYKEAFLTMPVSQTGELEIYGRPRFYRVISLDGKSLVNQEYSQYKDIVAFKQFPIMGSGFMPFSINYIVNYFSAYLAHIMTIQAVNSILLAKPYIIEADEKNLKTGLNMLKALFNYEPAFVSTKPQGVEGAKDILKVHQTLTNSNIRELQEFYTSIKNEFLTLMGINNVSDKKERMLVDEVNANTIEIMRGVPSLMLKSRQQAAKKIKDIYGFDVKVDFKGGVDNEVHKTNNDSHEFGNETISSGVRDSDGDE